ncbi:30S ribosomal protein S6 [Spiroplasma helicoides]|uniref:Small ribosomal subunit protein bS6 n=1 Tax=Spiroplasma helicoides TaxID=216938 RepID=A0A1B3SJ69_9MOLU|nr:30S ribosomal protein S6 [Spiroplasma helicoides]AOG59976.1 30S ribosomal protein S6 [Spiroplasma helicoides]
MIRKYEVMYIIDQDTTDVKAVQSKLHDILTANGGKILESEDWGLKEFAYEINKKRKGYYSVLIVETESENIEEFRRISKIDKNVVRELIINTENEKKYIQSTKLSKTDMSKFKEEKKPSRGFDRRPGGRRDDRGEANDARPKSDNNENNTQTSSENDVKKSAPAVKKSAEKHEVKEEALKKAPAKKETKKEEE